MQMRSHILSAVAMSCVLKTTVAPRRRFRARRPSRLRRSPDPGRRTVHPGSARTGCDTTAATNCTFWDMPFESASTCRSAQSWQLQPREPVVDDGVELGEAAPFEPAVVAKQAADGHLLVEPAFFRQVADAIARGCGVDATRAPRSPLVRQQDVHDHPERRGLAGAVRADEAVDGAGRHGRATDRRRRSCAPNRLLTRDRRMAAWRSVMSAGVRRFYLRRVRATLDWIDTL